MNRGQLIGSTQPQIQFYEPTIVCAANSGTPTNPSLTRIDGHTYQFGRFVQINPALVYVEIQLQFLGAQADSTGSVGSGGAYCFSLPPEFPLKRTNPGQIERVPISPGTGMCYLSFGSAAKPDVNVECVPVPADPWVTLNGQEDSYFSLMAPHCLDWGTFTMANGAAPYTVTHGLGYAFSAYDLETLVMTNTTPTNAFWPVNVPTVTTADFTVQSQNAAGPSGTTQAAAWKVRAEPPTGQAGALVGPAVPWDWTKVSAITPFGNFFVTLLYEPQA